MQALEHDIKQLIIEALDLEDLTPEDIDSAAPLFGDGLGLDSIDALELGMSLQKRYGIKLAANSEETRKHFASVQSLAALVASHQNQAAASAT
ncbi:acyl carrier protein [Herbaspirillum rubrisubalbicans M1]|uniref:phosphopantetheine-binding protein n=1 Tax=Herbaspirillum rubrisubalbicans TaxID=80842 RepID=UPI00073A2786|nr:phosphopantetheine-binding protein [Herbaspirillum rubrisubalbicans]ALU90828.1 acyl carrier protein [Herbaspirillum rubrisubalbicans M1]